MLVGSVADCQSVIEPGTNGADRAFWQVEKAVLKKNSVKVVSAKETFAEDSTGILLESLLEGYAEFYSADLSEKVIRGLTDNALKCKYNGGGLPVGYTVDDDQFFRLDPVTAPVVLEAFTLYAKGATIKQVADILGGKGIRTNRGKPMSIDSVKRMLKNRRYIGTLPTRTAYPPLSRRNCLTRCRSGCRRTKKPRPASRPRTNICLPPNCIAASAGRI